jgi:hypothetical protein
VQQEYLERVPEIVVIELVVADAVQLHRLVGQAGALKTRFNLSVTEAMAIYMNSDMQMALQVVLRECARASAARSSSSSTHAS